MVLAILLINPLETGHLFMIHLILKEKSFRITRKILKKCGLGTAVMSANVSNLYHTAACGPSRRGSPIDKENCYITILSAVNGSVVTS